jgi:Family of unknown function (DUF6502)
MSDLIPPRPGEPPRALTQAIVRLLRPLVRVLIAHGVTFPMLAQLLKDIYVGVAEEAFPLSGKAQTDSRLSLLTGVHRKDVRALRGRGRAGDRPSPVVSRNAQMMAIWAGAADYLDARGRPRALPRTGGRPSFESLVESVSKDIRPRVVLDEWQRLGLIRIDEHERVHLNNVASCHATTSPILPTISDAIYAITLLPAVTTLRAMNRPCLSVPCITKS